MSRFDYTYDADGQIQTWTKQADTTSTNTFTFQYDPVDQLLGAVLAQTGVATNILHQYVYAYDASGNRTGEQVDTNATGANYNVVNELTNQISNGMAQFAGYLSKTGVVSVAGGTAVITNQTNFSAYVTTQNGTNQVQITATDLDLNTGVTNYQLVVTNNGVGRTLTYDLNGNLITNATSTATNTFEWDAENRLTAVNEAGTNRSEFSYDGIGRRVQIVEKTNGVVATTKRFVWCGTELCEERDATGTNVTKRFLAQGEQISGTSYYFMRDHLGSVREMLDSGGTIHARYDYDPYGRRTKASGDLDADFGFTGDYYHAPSALCLTLFRAYDPNTFRWMSRDPLAKEGGLNLYAYVRNNPLNEVDPMGLWGGEADTSRGGVNNVPSMTISSDPCTGNAKAHNNDSAEAGQELALLGLAALLAGGLAAGLAGPDEAVAAGNEAFYFGEGALDAAIADGANIIQLSPEAEAALNAGNETHTLYESASFAANATGDITVYVGAGDSAGYTFWNYELPQLLNNVNNGTINSINYIFLNP